MWRTLALLSASLLTGFLGAVVALQLTLPTIVGAQEADVRARQYLVIGSDGANRGIFGETVSAQFGTVGTTLRLNNAEGVTRLALNTGFRAPEGAGLSLADHQGQQRIWLQVATDVERDTVGDLDRIAVLDQEGRVRLNLGVDGQGSPFIELRDAAGNITWQAR